jgi:hypothetical protein
LCAGYLCMDRRTEMKPFNRYATKLAGALLIVGPLLLVFAALLAAAGIGTTTGRWYDNPLEGILMATGFALQLVGLLELCRSIGARRPILGILAMLTSVIGTVGAIFPATVRILAAVYLNLGFSVEQLDRVYASSEEGPDPMLIFLPFILVFFLNYLVVLPLGLWRSKMGPRIAPVLLVIGSILFIMGQSSDEVGWPAYIAGVIAWFLALAGQGLSMLRETSSVKPVPSGAAAEN